ncbi:hypothetical protein, partial [Mycoplasmopsis bovis]|uniref:hypothetical protein n=1 Tax=Mycoplasmopsis bovis TaxID=28903 RepID=UPI003D26FE4A
EIPTKEKINIIKTLRLIDKEMDKAQLVREKFNNLLGHKDHSTENYRSRFVETLDYMNKENAEFIKKYFINQDEYSAKNRSRSKTNSRFYKFTSKNL